jgi:hypothetical protein
MSDTIVGQIRDMWSTPIGNGSKFEKKEGQSNMQSQTDLQLQTIAWSTPIAGDWKGQKRSEGEASMLCGQVELYKKWSTPQASDGIEGARTASDSNQKCLGRDLNELEKWATPITGDGCDQVQIVNWKTPTTMDTTEDGLKAATQLFFGKTVRHSGEQVQVKLNPRWVESLMGLPRNWVNPNGIVTEWKGWPMGMGKEQYDWEDTRTIDSKYKDITNRTDELRLLGNGVVPQCIEKAFAELFMRLTI